MPNCDHAGRGRAAPDRLQIVGSAIVCAYDQAAVNNIWPAPAATLGCGGVGSQPGHSPGLVLSLLSVAFRRHTLYQRHDISRLPDLKGEGELSRRCAYDPGALKPLEPRSVRRFRLWAEKPYRAVLQQSALPMHLSTRYDKTADSNPGFINLASSRLWFRRFVNRASLTDRIKVRFKSDQR